jgi:hypothetical protein
VPAPFGLDIWGPAALFGVARQNPNFADALGFAKERKARQMKQKVMKKSFVSLTRKIGG